FTFIYEGNGELRRPFVVVNAVIVLAAGVWLFSDRWAILSSHVGNNVFALGVIFVLSVPLTVFMGYPLVPFMQTHDVALLGEKAPPKELRDPFRLTGPATRFERVVVPMLAFAAVAAMTFFANFKKTGYD